jgi:hypothetical protein
MSTFQHQKLDKNLTQAGWLIAGLMGWAYLFIFDWRLAIAINLVLHGVRIMREIEKEKS